MKKFVLMTIGFTQPTPEIMNDWMTWFDSIKDRMLDQVGLMNGKELSKTGIKDLPMDENAITGYLIIKAENMEDALEVAKACPMISATKVYELMEHK